VAAAAGLVAPARAAADAVRVVRAAVVVPVRVAAVVVRVVRAVSRIVVRARRAAARVAGARAAATPAVVRRLPEVMADACS